MHVFGLFRLGMRSYTPQFVRFHFCLCFFLGPDIYYIVLPLCRLKDAEDAFIRAEQLFDEWKAMPAPPDEALMDTEISLRVAHAKCAFPRDCSLVTHLTSSYSAALLVFRLLVKREQLAPSAQEFDRARDVAARRHGPQSIVLIPILHGLGKIRD